MAKVLIVEDEQAIVDILEFNLMREGYEALTAMEGPEGLEKARSADPDLILLDVMLPGLTGFEICSQLRQEDFSMPIIMLTAKGEENDKVFGLEAGADDYITKPFSMRELMARVKANIRRRGMDHGAPASAQTTVGSLVMGESAYTVTKNGRPIDLTQKEFDLLRLLMAAPGKVFTREDLMKKVWNYDYFGDTRTVDVMTRRLREKIEDDPAAPTYILTKRGIGYYFTEG